MRKREQLGEKMSLIFTCQHILEKKKTVKIIMNFYNNYAKVLINSIWLWSPCALVNSAVIY